MKQILLVGLLGGLGVAAWLVAPRVRRRPQHQQPPISWDERVKSLGTLASGQPYQGRLRFTNNTSAPVTLLPQPCCGFTAAVEPLTVGPGQSGVVRLGGQTGLSTGGRPQRSMVRLLCQELPGYLDEVGVKYTVQPNWHPVPAQLRFDGVDEGSGVSQQLRIYLEPGAAPLVGVECESRSVSAVLVKSVPNDYYEYTIVVRSPLDQHSTFDSEIRFRTSDGRVPYVKVPIFLRVRSCASVEPERVNLGEFRVGRNIARTVRISGCHSLANAEVAEAPDWATVHLHRTSPSSMRLSLAVKRQRPGVFAGEVRLRLTTTHTFDASLVVTGMASE